MANEINTRDGSSAFVVVLIAITCAALGYAFYEHNAYTQLLASVNTPPANPSNASNTPADTNYPAISPSAGGTSTAASAMDSSGAASAAPLAPGATGMDSSGSAAGSGDNASAPSAAAPAAGSVAAPTGTAPAGTNP